MNDMRLVSVTETETLVISRYEDGARRALTVYREKAEAPAVTPRSPLASMHRVGSLAVARLEAAAATENDANEITWAWDQQWGVHE